MAVARIAPVSARRYSPPVARRVSPARPTVAPRALVLGLVAAGALLQHALVSAPLEPQPVRPTIVSGLAATSGATTGATLGAAPAASNSGAVGAGAASGSSRPAATKPVVAHQAVAALRAVAAPAASAPVAATPRIATTSSIVLPPVGAFGDAHRVAMGANPAGALMHAPSVSVAAIRAALRDAGSSALDATYADHKDAAEYIWDSGRVLGLDPAVVMAIFQHESQFGTRGMARQTLSVGNIRPLPGQPQLDGYRLYASWQQGVDDCYRLLRSYARNGAATIPQAIPVWAPPSDNNDTGAYISSVLGAMSALYAASATP